MTAEADASFTGGTLTADSLRTLDVTHRVALETLRMYPIAPAITRTVSNTFEFAGYTIPAGEKVIVATTVPHPWHEVAPQRERRDAASVASTSGVQHRATARLPRADHDRRGASP